MQKYNSAACHRFSLLTRKHMRARTHTRTRTPCAQAKLRVVPWDGYLKYYNLGDKHPGLIEKRRKVFADQLRGFLGAHDAAAVAEPKKSR